MTLREGPLTSNSEITDDNKKGKKKWKQEPERKLAAAPLIMERAATGLCTLPKLASKFTREWARTRSG